MVLLSFPEGKGIRVCFFFLKEMEYDSASLALRGGHADLLCFHAKRIRFRFVFFKEKE